MEHLDVILPHALALEQGETIDDLLAIHGHELAHYFEEHGPAHIAPPSGTCCTVTTAAGTRFDGQHRNGPE